MDGNLTSVSMYSGTCYSRLGMVIFFLLLIAGDVELNPWPGKHDNPREKEPNAASSDDQRKENLPAQAEDSEDIRVSRDTFVAQEGLLLPPKPQYPIVRSLSAPVTNVASFQAQNPVKPQLLQIVHLRMVKMQRGPRHSAVQNLW